MSLYDDVVLPDLGIKLNPTTSSVDNNNAATTTSSSKTTSVSTTTAEQQSNTTTTTTPSNSFANWNTNSLKLLQNQVETARKRQQQQHQLNSSLQLKPKSLVNNNRASNDIMMARKSLGSTTSVVTHQQTSSNNQSTSSISSELRFNSLTGKIEREDESLFASLAEEYDPMRPNDYEKLVKHLKPLVAPTTTTVTDKQQQKRGERSRSREKSRRRNRRSEGSSSSRSRSSSGSSGDRSSSDERRKRRRHKKKRGRDNKRRSGGRSSSGDRSRSRDRRRNEEQTGRKIATNTSNSQFAPPPTSSLVTDSSVDTKADGLVKAEKMMKLMGYREGEGLGKNKQGISVALQVEKTGVRSGRIIHEKETIEAAIQAKELQQQVIQEPAAIILPPSSPIIATNTSLPPPTTNTTQSTSASQVVVGIPAEIMKNMSKVILLRNMVDPGDVDDDLEGETKEECQKYGEVNQVIIFELPQRAAEEAVRIFIEFKTLPSAIKALTDLNGRYFGGRRVKASFYNYDKFKRLELADDVL